MSSIQVTSGQPPTAPPLPTTPLPPPPCRGFLAIANRLIVGPILKTLVFSTTPEVTRAWVDSICADWAFTSIIPAVRLGYRVEPLRLGGCTVSLSYGGVPGYWLLGIAYVAASPIRPLTLPASLTPCLSLSPSPLLQHFTAPIPATPSDFRAAFSFVYEPQLSAERAAAAAAASGATPAAPSASAGKDVDRDESANPAKVLDGLLLGLLGGLRGSGGAGGKQQPTEVRGGVAYPAEDIAALNAAKRFLVNVSGRGGPWSPSGFQEC